MNTLTLSVTLTPAVEPTPRPKKKTVVLNEDDILQLVRAAIFGDELPDKLGTAVSSFSQNLGLFAELEDEMDISVTVK